MTGFGHVVRIDGSDLAPITLAGAKIDYGRTSLLEQPSTPTAVLEILTRDAYPGAVRDYPEFGLGDWASDLSGFVDAYADAYEGVTSRITLGVPVTIVAGSPSGFVDAYADAYTGANMTRFTGSCQALDYDAGTIRLTATPQTAESWTRLYVGGTNASTVIPAEMESARMIRLAAEAGVTLIVDGPPTVMVTAIPKKTAAKPLMAWLLEIAQSARSVIFTDRDGWVHVRTLGYVPPATPETILPPASTLLDDLQMKTELGGVRNNVTVTYGPEDAQGDRPTVTVTDPDSIARYGQRDADVDTVIQLVGDATAYATWLMAQLDPWWTMPDATVVVSLLTPADAYAALNVEQGDTVTVPGLPSGAPMPEYTASALGYTETLSYDDWQISYHLSPMQGPNGPGML